MSRTHLVIVIGVALSVLWAAPAHAAITSAQTCIPWKVVQAPTDPEEGIAGIDGLSASDFWAVVDSFEAPHPARILHWDGHGWTSPPIQATDGDLKGVDVLSSTDAWAVGTVSAYQRTFSLHWNGSAWTSVPVPSPVGGYDILYGVSGTGASDVWAVGVTGYSHGLIAHWHGTSWTVAPHPQYAGGEEFRGVMAVAPDDAWAVGGKDLALEKPIIEHWDGVRWSDVQIPQVTQGGLLLGIDASGPDDVWAVGIGDGGALIYHWNGRIWTKLDNVPYGSTGEWWSVSSRAPNDVWVGGLNDQSGPPIASHWNGMRWTNTPTVSENKWFITIKAFSQEQVWAAGGGAGGIRVERFAGCG